jgi:ParB-like chromosome segregation protein Spo0J
LKPKKKIEINPEYASLVPPLSEEEYNSVKKSVKENGLYIPIIVDQNGIILDGHHRYKICKELGIEPQFLVRNFNDSLEEKLFVFQSNLQRRQLNNFQKTELALKSKSIVEEVARRNMSLGGSGKGKGSKCLESLGEKGVAEEIGKLAGVSHETVRKVEKIIECFPAEHLDKVRTGEISISQAHGIILLSEQKHKMGREFLSHFDKLVSEMAVIDDVMKKLRRLLTDSETQKEENRLQRKELGRMYARKLREYNKKDFDLRILLNKMAAYTAFLVAPSQNLENKAIEMFENLNKLAYYKSILDERRARIRDKDMITEDNR